jgi:endo-1,4-beta-xylanase
MIEGFSAGGAGAAKLGFKYPELFGSISIFAGALFTGTPSEPYPATERNKQAPPEEDPYKLAEKNADACRGRTIIRITAGDMDGCSKVDAVYHEVLKKKNIAHDFTIFPHISHNYIKLYDALGDKCWEFYYQAFRAKKEPHA